MWLVTIPACFVLGVVLIKEDFSEGYVFCMLGDFAVLPCDITTTTEVVRVVEEDIFFTDAIRDEAKATISAAEGSC